MPMAKYPGEGKRPTGDRPTYPIAKDTHGEYHIGTEGGGGYTGELGTKPPTGDRPIYPIAKSYADYPEGRNKVKPAIKHTPMGRQSAASQSGRDQAHGGAPAPGMGHSGKKMGGSHRKGRSQGGGY